MTTKNPISSSGSPATRQGSVCVGVELPLPRVGGVEVPDHERCGRDEDGGQQPSGLTQHPETEHDDEWEGAGQAEDQHRDVGPVRKAHRDLEDDRSPLSRLSTSSALIRHIGSPTPGTVLAPAYKRPSTSAETLAGRRNALCRSVCSRPSAPPRQEWNRSAKSAGPKVCRTRMRSRSSTAPDQDATWSIAASTVRSTISDPCPSAPPRPIATSAGTGTRMKRFSQPSGATVGSVSEGLQT